jgi:epoxyqueuosine reductase
MEEKSKNALTQKIKIEARRLGFQLVGVTRPDPPPHLATFEHWLQSGRHGEMVYLATDRARQRRADPLEILPECRAVLSLGIRHPAPGSANPPKAINNSGRVASYAWGEDYHLVLKNRLGSLVSYLEDQTRHPIANRWYTDTGPILEREFAQRAGLGWIGKNTCLINPHLGSYFLLAEIFLAIDLTPDQPISQDHCGSCTRCLEACPTACILSDRTIDARRCISYLTIELKGAIPHDLRPQLQDWVFGCDVCQEVCPWNIRFASPEGDPAFAPHADIPHPNLNAEMHLTPETFNQKFKGSPIKRPKRRGYLRNVAVALGNTKDPKAIPDLVPALFYDHEPLVRGHSAWALGQIGGESALNALQDARENESNPEVLAEIHAAINS